MKKLEIMDMVNRIKKQYLYNVEKGYFALARASKEELLFWDKKLKNKEYED